MIDYTLVVGVDKKHLDQLSWTWPTWKRNKPSLLKSPMAAFYDRDQVSGNELRSVIDHPDLKTVAWPPQGVEYSGGCDKWHNQQRYRMLAGFVHVPAKHVDTTYWLKLDTDVVATGNDDWIDPAWFDEDPSIVCQPWGFTKPANQMLILDAWAEKYAGSLGFKDCPPLRLVPQEGSDRVCHKRIISWCGFFWTAFTGVAARWAENTCGEGQLPVPSQDGYLWYVAQRLGLSIKRVQMKNRGWEHWSTTHNVVLAAKRAMEEFACC